MERMINATMHVLPSVVAFSKAKRSAPLAKKGENAISVMVCCESSGEGERRQAGAAQCGGLGRRSIRDDDA
jgi:hypothetical protein